MSTIFWTLVLRLKLLSIGVKSNGCIAKGPVTLNVNRRGKLELGKEVFFRPYCEIKIRDNGKIYIGDTVRIDFGVRIVVAQNYTVMLGNKVEIGYGSLINAGHDVTIGEQSAIGPNCVIQSSEHVVNGSQKSSIIEGNYHRSAILIGSRVWLSSFVICRPGSKIEDNTVIAAFSLVDGTYKSGFMYAGIPAKQKKQLS